MIKSINIKNVASYDDQGVQIDNLKKINFIYGANACGKTTISNFIHDSLDPKFHNCSLTWENSIPLEVLVYNIEFRSRNFGKGKLYGVFTLGEASAEQLANIEQKTNTLNIISLDKKKIMDNIENLNLEKSNLENSFRDKVWENIYKKHENIFKKAFSGYLVKEKFKTKLLQEAVVNNSTLETFESLKKTAQTVFVEQPQSIEPIPLISSERIFQIESDEIWEKIIIGKADVNISKLIQKLNIDDWVNQGRGYIKDNICPFCQEKTITSDFKNQIDKYFDETYLNEVNHINVLKQEYGRLTQNIISQLNLTEENQKTTVNTKLDIDKFSSFSKTLLSQYSANKEYLFNKIKEPSRRISLISTSEQMALISKLISSANIEIQQHNDIVLNYQNVKNSLIDAIWKYLIETHRSEITEFNKKQKGMERGIANLEEQLINKKLEYKRLDEEIKEVSKNITSIQPTINEINRILKSYGFLSFKIVPAPENGFYRIERDDGTIAESTLSEGEINFITFLYYFQLTRGGISQDQVNNERILVIDDPVSSLDSNVLFVVSTLIKDIIKSIKTDSGNIKQLILLTHNVYFHKEVSFINGRAKSCNETNFWILRKNDRITTLQSFETKNPIQSSYGLLWQEYIREEALSSITIQNTMRRIIESYFKLLGKYGDDDLVLKFQTKEEQNICRSLVSWINDGSHCVNDDLYVELQDRTIASYKKVFKEIFKLTGNEGHYEMMMESSDEMH